MLADHAVAVDVEYGACDAACVVLSVLGLEVCVCGGLVGFVRGWVVVWHGGESVVGWGGELWWHDG